MGEDHGSHSSSGSWAPWDLRSLVAQGDGLLKALQYCFCFMFVFWPGGK